MTGLTQKVKSMYQLSRDEQVFLDIAEREINSERHREHRFIVVNELTRRRFKTTAMLLLAIKDGLDIVTQTSYQKHYIEQTLSKWQEHLELEMLPKVHVLGHGTYGLQPENGFVVDELFDAKPEDIEHILYQVRVGFIEQNLYTRLVKEGLL